MKLHGTWIILANTAYLSRISGMTVSNGLHNTPHGHSLPTDCTVKCSCIRTFGIVLRYLDECLCIHFVMPSSVLTNLWANLEID